MSVSFEIREVESHSDIAECIDLQRRTWGLPDVDITPARLFVMARWAGTPPLGAYDSSGRIVAFLHTLPSRFGGVVSYYSHMLAVDERFRDSGIGYALKLEQRARAISDGVSLVVWTFDPLQSRNAHFNLNKLGAIVRRYVENFYGEHHASVFDAGVGSDRVFAEWWVGSPRVDRALASIGEPTLELAPSVEIPADFSAVRAADLDRAILWRLRTREAFQSHLSRGLVAVAVARDLGEDSSRYLFSDAEAVNDAYRYDR